MGSLVLAYVSRASLLRPHSHGFYRFFAWEAILALALVNLPVWFHDWLSWNQIVSWVLLCSALVPLALGVDALIQRGHADPSARPEAELLTFERTSKLVSAGVYRYIRHPLYCSLLLLAWGIFFKAPTALGVALVAAATVSLILCARADEGECLRVFGKDYRTYMRRTKMFIPGVL